MSRVGRRKRKDTPRSEKATQRDVERARKLCAYKSCPYCRRRIEKGALENHINKTCKKGLRTARERTRVSPEILTFMQKRIAEEGRKWVIVLCERCDTEVRIHVDWDRPLVLCRSCRLKRDHKLGEKRAQTATSKAFSPKMPKEGKPVGGGLPSLGKRR